MDYIPTVYLPSLDIRYCPTNLLLFWSFEFNVSPYGSLGSAQCLFNEKFTFIIVIPKFASASYDFVPFSGKCARKNLCGASRNI